MKRIFPSIQQQLWSSVSSIFIELLVCIVYERVQQHSHRFGNDVALKISLALMVRNCARVVYILAKFVI